MKKITIIFTTLLIIVLVATLLGFLSVNVSLGDTSSFNNTNITTQENKEGSVFVTVTPLSVETTSSVWDFEVSLDTHSGSLDADLADVSELIDVQGKIYKPISWEGDGAGGHHRKGILKFNSISPRPKSVELKIKNIGGIDERSFIWNF